MTQWFCEGLALDTISIDDRAVQYGDGLFETVAIRGGEPRLWRYHIERLQTGCARLGLATPAEAALEDALSSAVAGSRIDAECCVAKILVSAGQAPRGYRRDLDGKVTILIGLSESARLPEAVYKDGVIVRLCNTRLATQPQLAGIKTLNRLEQVMARREWHDEAVFEGLMLDTDDRLICGTMSNVFLIDGQSLVTPAITRCGVSGVMRRHVLTLLAEAGIDGEVRDVAIDEMWSCDGVLITNSQFGALPVKRCGDKSWQTGDMTHRIMQLLADSGIGEQPA